MLPKTPKALRPQDLQMMPLAHAETLPADWYTDPDFAAFDRDVIFKKVWQYLGPASRVAREGAFMVEEVGGVPLIVVRGADGTCRAFANVCRHRGGVLATADGHGRMLRCHYHGWTYSLEGKLAGTPHFPDKCTLTAEQSQLPEYAVQIWQGMVFVNLSQDVKPFTETFGGIVERMQPQQVAQAFYSRVTYAVEANWKVYVDNYLEGYHVPVVHPELSQIIDNSEYHYELSNRYSLQQSPVSSDQNPYGVQGTAFYFWIFPNIMLNILPGRMQVNSVVPDGPNRCQIHFDSYFEVGPNGDLEARAVADIGFSELVQAQDASVCLAVQKGLRSGTYHKGRLVPSQEQAVHHFHNLLRDTFRSYAP